MKQQNHPHDIRTTSAGVDMDTDQELHPKKEGAVVDRHNMRTTGMDGHNEASSKIKGEEILYPNIDNRCNAGSGLPLSITYECVGVEEINGHIIEFWADRDDLEDAIIRIDGLIVLQSEDFPLQAEFPLQIAKNESCIGGEIYLTDFNSTPMLFNINDLLLNSGVDAGGEIGSCTPKYFEDFNLQEHILVLNRTLEHPVFIKLDTNIASYDYVFGGTGLPVGYVTYSHRYVTTLGERTGFSAPTPQIPILKTVSSSCDQYPNSKAISKDPDISAPTIYGSHIRIRVNNTGNYDSIEIRRDSWIAGSYFGTPASSVICGRIAILPGQFGILDLLDKGGFEEATSSEDTANVMTAIARAKAIRYFNNRLYLMNVEYESRDVEETVTMIDEGLTSVMFPAIRKIYKDGHSDPHKAAYYKSTMRGEKHGYGVVLWDEQGQSSFAKNIGGAENFQMPQRRELTSALTEGVSYYGTVKAAHVDGILGYNDGIGQTHEVFDLVNAVEKSDNCAYANILTSGERSESDMDYVTDIDHGNCPSISIEGWGTPVNMNQMGYWPWLPVSQDDDRCDHLNWNPVIAVGVKDGFSTPYHPKGFSPEYYSAGVAFKGVESLPSWAKAFSIVKTPPATKVVAQGLAYYQMVGSEGDLGTNTFKKNDQIALYLPDLDVNIGINTTIVDDIRADPTAFRIKVVSALGFFTEMASFLESTTFGIIERDRCVDLITYARIIEDRAGGINPFSGDSENLDAGIVDPADSNTHYTGFGKWRAGAWSIVSEFPNGVASGASSEFEILGFDDYVSQSARSNYFVVTVDRDIFDTGSTDGDLDTNDTNVQNWHEPLYVVNIIRVSADVPVTNATRFESTGHYQKLSSIVGISDGSVNQSYELVDERWEDCRVSPNGEVQNDYSSLYRFVWIKLVDETELRWVNIDNITAGALTSILTDISNNGFAVLTDASGTYSVYGVYKTAETTDYTAKIFSVVFAHSSLGYDVGIFIPLEGSEVIVKYDNRIPVRVFGGDTWINESIWAVKDKEFMDNGKNINNGDKDTGNGVGDFRLSIPFPYKRMRANPRQVIARNTSGVNKTQNGYWANVSPLGIHNMSIRQIITMWTAESRVNLSFAFNDESTPHNQDQTFPLKNYIQRPCKWKEGQFGTNDAAVIYADNNIAIEYEADYGEEYLNWKYGGYRFLPQINLDYSNVDNTRAYSSVPQIGYVDQNKFCTRIIWSEKRPINVQDSPSVQTFFSQNIYDISDNTGAIKRAFDAISGKGNNLYAFTDSGVCLLLVDKRVIHEINANELATVGSDVGGIQNELWLNKEIGMNDEMWRSAGEYSNLLSWVNKNSAYVLSENSIIDIGRKGYHSYIKSNFLDNLNEGYADKITGVYDVLHNEYWCNINLYHEDPLKVTKRPTLSYGHVNQHWEGTNDYNFDKFLSFNNETYGMSGMETYSLNKGTIISGEQILAFITQVSAASSMGYGSSRVSVSDKEFIRIRVSSDNKPTKVEFFSDLAGLLINDVKATLDTIANPLALKDYNGFEQYIPRETISRDRMQGRLLIFKISHNLDENFKVVSTDIQYKPLK